MTKLSLHTSIASLAAQRSLHKATSKLSTSMERLSSGLRINHASDDPAGLAISNSLQVDSRIFAQAVRNVSDGISALSIVESALQEIVSITTRQLELAEQAATGTLTTSQRVAIQEESDALVAEVNRIDASSEFNGRNLYDFSTSSLEIQAGKNAEGTISFDLLEESMRTVSNGSFAAPHSLESADGAAYLTGHIDGDSNIDLVMADYGDDTLSVFLGNGDGTFAARTTLQGVDNAAFPRLADLNGDERLDLFAGSRGASGTLDVFIGNGNGTFEARKSYASDVQIFSSEAADMNNDGILDIVSDHLILGTISVYIGNGDGTFQARTSFQTPATYMQPANVWDLNDDGNLDAVAADRDSDSALVLLGNGDGTFKAAVQYAAGDNPHISIADVNRDGIIDLLSVGEDDDSLNILFGKGDGTFEQKKSYQAPAAPTIVYSYGNDFNQDGLFDIAVLGSTDNVLAIYDGQTDGISGAYKTHSLLAGMTVAIPTDLNSDNVLDLIVDAPADGALHTLLSNTTQTIEMPHLYMLNQEGAQNAVADLTLGLEIVTADLGAVGAAQSRLGHTMTHLQVMRENYLAANSRIVDADIAEEVAEMVRQQVLQQAATAVLAQANLEQGLVLELLA